MTVNFAETWTVNDIQFPDRETAFSAARTWADERGDSVVAWAQRPGHEEEGWRVKPGTPLVADVVAGRADIPVKHLRLAQLLALATPDELVGLRARLDIELSTDRAAVVWRAAESCVCLYRYGPGFDH